MKARIKRLYDEFGGNLALARLIAITTLFTLLFFLDFIGAWNDVGRANLNGWIGAFINSFTNACVFVSFALVFPQCVSKVFYSISLGWVSLFSLISMFMQQNFGVVLRGETLTILIASSREEVMDFLRLYAKPMTILCCIALVFLCFVISICAARCKYFKQSKMSIIVFLLMYIPVLSWSWFFCGNKTFNKVFKNCNIHERVSAFSFFQSLSVTNDQFKELIAASHNPLLPANLMNASKDKDIFGVFVLGESATRNRLSLFGYEKCTTPLLDARRSSLMIFDNLVTPASTTTQASRYILTKASEENPNEAKYMFASICKRAGYDCVFLSSQYHWGAFDGVDALFFADCDSKHWIHDEVALRHGEEKYDELLLPYVKRVLDAGSGLTALFVHLQGSHMDAKDRYPPSMAKFGLDEKGVLRKDATRSEHYDNSIAYTDYVLDETLAMLEKRGGASFMIYLSDHGESPSSEYWRYAPDKDLWEVPMFIWMSEEYKAKYPEIVEQIKKSVNKPLVSDQLLFGFTRLFLIDGLPDYKEEEDFLSDKFVPRAKRYNDNVENVE